MPYAESSVNKDAQTPTTQTTPHLTAVRSAAADDAAHRAATLHDLKTLRVYLHSSDVSAALGKALRDVGAKHVVVPHPEQCKPYPVNSITICAESRDEIERWSKALWVQSTVHVAVGNWRVWAAKGDTDAAEAALQAAYVHEARRPPDMSIIQPRQSATPLPTMDPFVLGHELGAWARDTAANCSAPVDYFVATLLAVCGGAIGSARAFVTSKGFSEQPILWIADIGIPGSGKSTAIKAVGAAVSDVEAELMAGFTERVRAHEGKILAAEARIAKWKADIQKAVEAGRPEPERPANAVPVPPLTPPRLRTTDATPEALALLLGSGSRGMLVYADELATWFEGHSKYNGDASGFWLSAYNGEPNPVDRKGGGNMPIPSCTVSVVGGIPPERLHALMLRHDGGGESGLASRFLFCWPQPAGELILEDEESDAPVSHAVVSRALRRLRTLPRETDANGAIVVKKIPFERGAAAMRNTINAALSRHAAAASGQMVFAINKMRGQIHRLAMVIEYARWAAGPDDVPEPATISLAALADAARLVLEYFKPMAERVYGEGATPPSETDAGEVARALLQHRPTTFNASKDRRRLGFRHWTGERFAAALQVLDEVNWIEYCGERKPDACGMVRKGRRSTDYCVVPEVYRLHGISHPANP